MEMVAAAAGGSWTDRPTCTPPVLAHLARAVNDSTTSETRPKLASFIPDLVTRPDLDGQRQADIAVVAVILAAAAAADTVPRGPMVALMRQRDQVAAVGEARAGLLPRLKAARLHHRFMLVTRAVVRAMCASNSQGDRDERLHALLLAAVNAQRRIEGLPEICAARRSYDLGADGVALLTRQITPVGADWRELEVSLDFDRSPTWLLESWKRRHAELRQAVAGAGRQSSRVAGPPSPPDWNRESSALRDKQALDVKGT
ncbi:hypothetical protein OG809_33225 [Kribbella soli]